MFEYSYADETVLKLSILVFRLSNKESKKE